jgi:hypothetical protein
MLGTDHVLGNFVNALSTGERLKTKTVSANNNFYARPKTSKRINSLLLKADMTNKEIRVKVNAIHRLKQ